MLRSRRVGSPDQSWGEGSKFGIDGRWTSKVALSRSGPEAVGSSLEVAREIRQFILSVMDVDIVSDRKRALALLKPPRRRILELARTPATAVELAEQLEMPRQRVGYHVRELVQAGLLAETEVRQRGSVTEKRYRSNADGYVLSPDLLGALAAQPDSGDAASAAHLFGSAHRVLREVEGAFVGASQRVPTLTVSSRIRFRDANQRGVFARALADALTDVVGRYTEPFEGDEAGGDPFRLTLLLHPTPTEPTPDMEDET